MGVLTAASAGMSSATQTAVANGDTRTIYLFHAHTKERIAATFRVNGQYDPSALKQLNWFLRDWRHEEPTNMDPRLFDVLWEVYRSAGAGNSEITVMSAYRSPATNSMLRRRSRAVARHSQHMLGKAMDTSMPGMPMERIREIGMRLQRGGVGYYPTAGTPFVHLDVGSVRSWPRMNYDQLVRLFPDGKTVHLPANGQPLARYEEARAELEARGGVYVPPSQKSKSFFAFLFGGEDAEESAPAVSYERPRGGRRGTQVAAYAPAQPQQEDDGGSRSFFLFGGRSQPQQPAQPQPPAAEIARAESDLPRGETYMGPPGQTNEGASDNAAERGPRAARGQDSGKPQPLDAEETGADRNGREAAAPDRSAPLPPRRPSDLPVFASAPTPPTRPAQLAAIAPALAPSSGVRGPLTGVQRDLAAASISQGARNLASANVSGLRAAARSEAGAPAMPVPRPAALAPGLIGARAIARGQGVQGANARETAARQVADAPTPPPRPGARPGAKTRNN